MSNLGGDIALTVDPIAAYSNVLDLAGLSYNVNSDIQKQAYLRLSFTNLPQYSTTGTGTGFE